MRARPARAICIACHPQAGWYGPRSPNGSQKELAWATEYGVSPHWLRHTAIATVERIAGFGVARAFAGHTSQAETTTTYITASPEEIARAVSALTGEAHPLVIDAST